MLTKSLFTELQEDTAARDEMLKIGRMYHRFSIFSEFASQDSFANAIRKLTPTLIQELNHAF